MARSDPTIKDSKGISAFIVNASPLGITLGSKDKKIGQHGSHTYDVIFENCHVPAQNIISGVAAKGFITSMKVLDRSRLHISAFSVGITEHLIDDALRYAIDRKQFGKLIAQHQMF